MRRTRALAVVVSSAALLGFTALAAAPAASAGTAGSGYEKTAPASADTGKSDEEMPPGVAISKNADGSLDIQALTQEEIDGVDGDWGSTK
ncbi:hypothetical protein ACWF94_23285 [Streptomyces sp. NPDC055078]